jgi:hypothetical protein
MMDAPLCPKRQLPVGISSNPSSLAKTIFSRRHKSGIRKNRQIAYGSQRRYDPTTKRPKKTEYTVSNAFRENFEAILTSMPSAPNGTILGYRAICVAGPLAARRGRISSKIAGFFILAA